MNTQTASAPTAYKTIAMPAEGKTYQYVEHIVKQAKLGVRFVVACPTTDLCAQTFTDIDALFPQDERLATGVFLARVDRKVLENQPFTPVGKVLSEKLAHKIEIIVCCHEGLWRVENQRLFEGYTVVCDEVPTVLDINSANIQTFDPLLRSQLEEDDNGFWKIRHGLRKELDRATGRYRRGDDMSPTEDMYRLYMAALDNGFIVRKQHTNSEGNVTSVFWSHVALNKRLGGLMEHCDEFHILAAEIDATLTGQVLTNHYGHKLTVSEVPFRPRDLKLEGKIEIRPLYLGEEGEPTDESQKISRTKMFKQVELQKDGSLRLIGKNMIIDKKMDTLFKRMLQTIIDNYKSNVLVLLNDAGGRENLGREMLADAGVPHTVLPNKAHGLNEFQGYHEIASLMTFEPRG